MRLNKQIDIRRALALASTFHFLRCCSSACLLPFLTLYFRQLGLTPAMTGVVMGAKHLITLVLSPAGSWLSRRYDKRRAVILCSLMGSVVLALMLLLLPPAGGSGPAPSGPCNLSTSHPVQSEDTLTSGTLPPGGAEPETSTAPQPQPSNQTEGTNATSVSLQDGETHPVNETHNGSVAARSKRSSSEEETEESYLDFLGSLKVMDPQHQLFFLVLITVSLWECASAPLEWTADDGLYEYLDCADASERYSSTAVWGLLGAAVGVGGSGLLVSRLGCPGGAAGPGLGSSLHFYCYAAAAALALGAACCLPLHLTRKRAGGLLKAAQLVRASPRALLCAVTAVVVGAAGSALDNFLLWQMQDGGAAELHMGLTLATGLLAQACFPLLSGRASRLLGPGRLLVAAAAALGLQCLYYSFLWGPWAALGAQLLSCLSAGAYSWVVGQHSEEVATPGAERSVSRLFKTLCPQLGAGLGSVAGGLVAQRWGLAWMFRAVAAVVALWAVCLPLLQWKAPRQRRINYSRLLAADASEASDSESEQERDWLDKALQDDRGNNNCGRRVHH